MGNEILISSTQFPYFVWLAFCIMYRFRVEIFYIVYEPFIYNACIYNLFVLFLRYLFIGCTAKKLIYELLIPYTWKLSYWFLIESCLWIINIDTDMAQKTVKPRYRSTTSLKHLVELHDKLSNDVVERIKATPFGWLLKLDNSSSYQTSSTILGMLVQR